MENPKHSEWSLVNLSVVCIGVLESKLSHLQVLKMTLIGNGEYCIF